MAVNTKNLSYLVSTAGHAQHQNERYPHDIRSIVQLVEDGAEEFGEEKVVGFTSLGEAGEWKCDRYSFHGLLSLADWLSEKLAAAGITAAASDNPIISLLCPTGLDFLIAWLALMRGGYGVVFIAPQCSPSAIAHLLSSSNSTQLLVHPKYADLAHAAHALNDTPLAELPSLTHSHTVDRPRSNGRGIDDPVKTISHIFHTSGTSGTPKPIPNHHYQSVSVLPRRALPRYLSRTHSEGSDWTAEAAAFTTTPLFHGGVSDLLRAWMARSMIYFYPISDVPITVSNVVTAVEACNSPLPAVSSLTLDEAGEQERADRFGVFAFLSVPYILSVLAEDLDGPGIGMLRKLDFVSTGGAPLDTRIGDAMVKKGVKLVSRLGSSECGFLLSSHRHYENEQDWEWLRNDSSYADALSFEKTSEDANKFEMVVTPKWRSKTKSNRDDGSYATGDLYSPHKTKRDVWKYVGRGDDVIVMNNGEKASPGPIETVLRSCPHLADALVVGANRTHLGVLLFPKTASTDLLDQIISALEEANKASPSFAQISREACVVIDDAEKTLPKSSKGTIQRGVAYDIFKTEIEGLYGGTWAGADLPKRDVGEIKEILRQLILDVTPSGDAKASLADDTDLFNWGIDSLKATRIRSSVIQRLNTGDTAPSRNVVFEYPSIEKLAQHIHDLQQGTASSGSIADPHVLMEKLAARYGFFEERPQQTFISSRKQDTGKTIVLTGSTGSLGVFILSKLASLPRDVVDRVICLVRASDDKAAERRVASVLKQRQLVVDTARYEVYSADLSKPDLGLDPDVYGALRNRVNDVVHAAWPVHFASSLVSFKDSIKGTRHLLHLVASSSSREARLFFCSSLASVLGRPPPDNVILERPTDDPATASPIGYSQSKWVTEKICRLATEQSGMAGRVSILRVGQLCGDTQTGHWNEKEGWPLLIKTADTTGCLPILQERPSWLPVDLAAAAILDVVMSSHVDPIYHIAHPDCFEWEDLLSGLEVAGLHFKRVSAVEWLEKVEASSDDPEVNPSKQMLGMWQAAYGKGSKLYTHVEVDTSRAKRASITLSQVPELDRGQISRTVEAWRRSGFLRS